MLLEREVSSCADLQFISCYRGWKEACHVMRAISTTLWHELLSCLFFLQGKTPKKILTGTLGEYAPTYATIKNWVAQFERGDLSNCVAPHFGRHKIVTIPEIIDQIHELILEDQDQLYQKLSDWPPHVGGLGQSFMKIWTSGSSPRSGSRNAWTRI